MKGYVVCVYKSISNEEKLKEYAVKARAAVEKYKGRFLIRGGRSTSNEGEKNKQAKNKTPITNEVIPVLPPAFTPAPDST